MWGNPSGSGPGGIPSFQGFGGSIPSSERHERQQRISPFIQPIRNGEQLAFNKEIIQGMLKDFKKEGNDLFKDKNYMSAGEHYTCALFISRQIESLHFADVDKELLSALFSNRAACFLKMDLYSTGIEDCDYSINFNQLNIKAYYRKATALKSLKKYEEALKAALNGCQVAKELDRKNEIHDFEDLIREISSHLTPQFAQPRHTAKKESLTTATTQVTTQPVHVSQKSKEHTTPTVTMLPTQQTQPMQTTSAVQKPKASAIAPVVKSSAQPPGINDSTKTTSTLHVNPTATSVSTAASASSQVKTAEVSAKNTLKPSYDVDETWLKGTNVNVRKATAVSENVKQKKQRNKKVSDVKQDSAKGNAPYRGVFSLLQDVDNDDDDDDSTSSEAEDVESTEKMLVDGITGSRQTHHANYDQSSLSWADQSEHIECSNGYGRHSMAASQSQITSKARPVDYITGHMGLDEDFGFGGSLPKSRNISSGQPQAMDARPNVTPIQQSHHDPKDYSADFQPITSKNTLPYPFNSKYDFTFACGLCFVESQTGFPEKQYFANLPHSCTKDLFIVRFRNSPKKEWFNIRSRPKVQFTGFYRLCQQYMIGESCKVSRALCSFCHSEAEMHLWTLDRSEQFDMSSFLNKWQALAKGNVPAYKPTMQDLLTASNIQQHPPQLQVYGQQQQWQNTPQQQQQPVYSSSQQAQKQYAPFQQAQKQYAPMLQLYQAPPAEAPYTTAHVVQQPDGNTLQRYIFPLKDSHKFRVVCSECLLFSVEDSLYYIKPFNHQCSENLLAVQTKGQNYWLRIRERINHRVFHGNYVMCRFHGLQIPCKMGDNCMFAHNVEEQILWTREKDGQFNITEFILQNRSPQTRHCFSLDDLFKKHPGCFQFLCHACFYSKPCRISIQDTESPMLCSFKVHNWKENSLLIHVSFEKSITPIVERPFSHKGAFFLLCHKMQFCIRREKTRCCFAHSMVERDVWLIERDHNINRVDLVQMSQEFLVKLLANKDQGQGQGSPQHQSQSPVKRSQPGAEMTTAQSKLKSGQVPSVQVPEAPSCPFRVLEVCSLCRKQGRKIQRDKSRQDRCSGSGMGHMWTQNRAKVLIPENILIRPLPNKIPTGCRFILCKHVREKRKCDYSLGGYCQFAHSSQEMDVWTWMVKNNISTLDDLVRVSEHAQKANTTVTKPIPKGQSVVWAKPLPVAPAANHMSPFQLSVNALYCHYCSTQCNGQRQWDDHCASDKHLFNLNSDKEHQWNYRQPPWGLYGGSYELCKLHEEKKCRYSDKPDVYNFCKFAHSQEELDEWKERWDWRQMKREIARSENMYSFMEQLLQEYDSVTAGIDVITEDVTMVTDVTISCQTELSVFMQEKTSSHTWRFDIQTSPNKPLQRVALMHNHDRLHFSLVIDDQSEPSQISQGESFLTHARPGEYQVQVQFTGGIFGSFMQWVVFDFGSRPVLVRKLGMELGTNFVQEKVMQLRQHLQFDRWTGENRQIIPYDERSEDTNTFPACLLKRYKPPSSADAVITHHSVATELNRHNYMHKMHKLLEIEELTRAQIISSYNIEAEIDVQQCIQEEGVMINSNPGELFAKVALNDQLSEDTDAGKLILTSVQSVLLAPLNTADDKVYEATMVKKDNFDYDGRGRDYIYICISPRCVRDLELQSGYFLTVEIQFKMDRIPFCRMHLAVDQLENNDVVFPDVSKINSQWNEKRVFDISSQVLNAEQLNIVKHIVAERSTYSPPIVVFGPFGTGKTETLAQAAMVLVTKNYDSRVLICTHSNSAADLYITKHFDTFVRKNQDLSVLRVYSHERRVNTVQPIVKNYCLLTPDKQSFITPDRESILSHHIIITTLSTSLSLSKLHDLKGFLSHIFIDEAAQAFECEAIMPLALATENTCVVLTGDHLQMGPKVYSQEAKLQKFHRSLLERLYHHYDDFHSTETGTSPLNILLSINYRTKMEILRFISAIFYGSPDRLHSASGLQDVSGVIPLTFYTALGHEVQDTDSTTFYNMAEVEEVVARVAELYENWPVEWGERRADSIGVVTPYTEQVNRIRQHLRRRKLHGVTVERVMNIQGKEFRVLFLSTVRTIHLADNMPQLSKTITESDGDVGDFGFLSDNKLLNTALTRAQSFVGVVGDPMALCAIGECVRIWRAYLKHCEQMGSIKPNTVTMQSVRDQVVNLMNTPKGQNLQMLNALSQEFKELRPSQVAQTSGSGTNLTSSSQEGTHRTSDSTQLGEASMSGSSSDWDSEHQLEPDDIIKQLAKEALKVCQQEREKTKTAESSTEDHPLIDCVRVREDEGHAILLYRPSWTDQAPKRHLLGAEDHDQEFDSDDDFDGDDQLDADSVYVDFTNQQLMGMVQAQPDIYKHCILHIEHSSRMYATIRSPHCDMKEIKIGSRIRCNRAFDGDEVVVELLAADEEDTAALEDTDKQIKQGQVVGILRRAINPQYRMFVCMVEEGNTGMMVPLNRGIPKMFNLETKNRLKKTRRGHVCVYTFSKDREIIFDHYEPIDSSDPMKKLFIVRYLKWDAKFYSPLGIVVGILPAGTTVERGLQILNIEYSIPQKFKSSTEQEMARSFNRFTIPKSEYGRRMDFREPMTFTVDPEGSEDLDDALSIETLPNGQFRVGIHIADVSFFVKKGSPLDEEARSRATSFYPAGCQPVPMLPCQLSTDLCSLKAGEDRLSLSLFITINTSAQLVDTQVRRCIINSNYRLTYEEVEDVLDGDDIDQPITDELKLSLHRLHTIAHRWRKQRLGNQGLYMNLDAEDALTPKAHLMVEELMIKANHQVALLLLQNFPECTPLRTQLPPNEISLDEWRQRNAGIAKNSVALLQPFMHHGRVCLCTDSCTCIESSSNEMSTISIKSESWQELMGVVANADGLKLEDLITIATNPENSPEMTVALLELWGLQERGNYVCSSDTPEDIQLHYSLKMMAYTHFTSPIRRYIDLVVHRLLGALLAKQSSPYTGREIVAICVQCTEASQKARRFEKQTQTLQLSALLQNNPATLHPVIESVDESKFNLRFPKLGGLVPSRSCVMLSMLGLSEKPSLVEGSICAKWQNRIYDVKPDPGADVGGIHEVAILNPDRNIVKVLVSDWQQLLFAIIRGDTEGILLNLIRANEKAQNLSPRDQYTEDVSSEVNNISHSKHFCDYSLVIKHASLMKVQLTSELFKGLMSPQLQLLEVTPTLDICLEHRTSPALCFANNTTLQASKPQYRDEASYKSSWLRVLSIESAHSSSLSGDSVTIHNVAITWTHNGNKPTGTFTLPLWFCLPRQIIFSNSSNQNDEDEEEDADNQNDDQFLDYFCIRYGQLSPPRPASDFGDKFDIDFELPYTWVGHCLSTKKYVNKKKSTVTVTLQLHQNSVEMPKELLNGGQDHQATIEFIPKALPCRRQEAAIRCLDKATLLAKNIALGQKPPNLDEFHKSAIKDLKHMDIPNLPAPNQAQQFAISNALTLAFSLIQGPPGTGKTVTGVRIAYLLVQFNKTQPKCKNITPQVLYCGPSNKSVDVVTAYLKKLRGHCPKLVRVYSEAIELQEYPLPMDSISASCHRQQAYNIDPDIRDLALHNIIRDQTHCTVAAIIRDFDERIKQSRESGELFSTADLEHYRNVIAHAEVEVLKTCEIILSTCNMSSSPKIRHSTKIAQLIIDESGMCTEPESMVPIVTSRAKQVILIGDHKQLRPIVLNDRSRNLGLETSLFERYSSKAYMLTQQYRMHESIADFPSQQFYNSRLDCGTDEQSKPSQLKFWPNGRNKPISFVHVMGKEETLNVTTSEGSERSKSNMEEVVQAVRAASLLVRRFHVNPKEVVVMSQYRAQCAEIQRALHQRGEKDINISTVVAAQGSEWDYVILSTVRSLPKSEIENHPTKGWCRRKLGFITDEHQINVAITRARKGLIFIGNKYLLSCDLMWKKLLAHYEQQRKVTTTAEFMA